MWTSQVRGGAIPGNNGSGCNRDGASSWSGGHPVSAKILNETSCNTSGMLSIRTIHVDTDVTQGIGLGVKRKAMSHMRRAEQAVLSLARLRDMNLRT